MNTLDLAGKDVSLKKVAGTYGGEWQGPCPACGGEDRFHVWPEQNEGKGAYWCRGCEKAGDNIQYLRDFRGMSFRDACAELRIDIPAGRDYWRTGEHRDGRTLAGAGASRFTPGTQRGAGKPDFHPAAHASPAGLWREKAEKLAAWAGAALLDNADALAWLAARGISRETAINYRLGWNVGEDGKDLYRHRKSWGLPEQIKDDGRLKALWIPRGLIIPYIEGGDIHRIRIRRPEGDPRYYVLPGSSMATMIIERARRAFVVVESELDAIAVGAANTLAGAVALGSVSAKPDAEAFAVLRGALSILNALDYDAAGAKAYDWWAEQFGDRCARWPVPQGKDPGDAARLGIDLEQWIKAGLPPALTIAPPVTGGMRKVGGSVSPSEKTVSPALRWGPQGNSPVPERAESDGRVSHQNAANRQPGAPAEKMLDFDRDAPAVPVEIRELYALLRNNPGVKIINTPTRYTVLRNGKYVGGRINELVFRHPVSRDYLLNHPADEIDAGNLIA